MTPGRSVFALLVMVCFSHGILTAQDEGGGWGFGGSFGLTGAEADVESFEDAPTGRLFVRFFPARVLAIDAGLGMGQLKGRDDTSIFRTTIYPADIRDRLK